MANIKITVEGPLMDGHKVTFKAPCNCDVVEKLDVRYIENNTQKSKLFTMKDSHGNDLTGLGNLFFKDAYVDVVLDPNSGSAYLQNAGTNGYLEERLKTAGTPVDNLLSDRADLPLSARQGKILNESLGGLRFGYDGDSNSYGYYGADGSLIPFKSSAEIVFYFSGLASSTAKPSTDQSTAMSFTITEKGTYTIICMTNGYRNAGYDVYKNTEKICTVALSTGGSSISTKSYTFDCNVGDSISISNIKADVSLMAISALLMK